MITLLQQPEKPFSWQKSLIVAEALVFLTFLLAAKGVAQESGSAPEQNKGEEKVRVLVYPDKEAQAISNGCRLKRDARTVKAFMCSKDVVQSLGLEEEKKVQALDTDANAQIGADIVQAGGNTGQGRKIVVLDSGYDYNNPELSSSYLGGYDFVNDDNDPMDDVSHGTSVSMIATGDGVTNPFFKGVAPDVGIIAGKIANSEGAYPTNKKIMHQL